jgi:hypothetical protein
MPVMAHCGPRRNRRISLSAGVSIARTSYLADFVVSNCQHSIPNISLCGPKIGLLAACLSLQITRERSSSRTRLNEINNYGFAHALSPLQTPIFFLSEKPLTLFHFLFQTSHDSAEKRQVIRGAEHSKRKQKNYLVEEVKLMSRRAEGGFAVCTEKQYVVGEVSEGKKESFESIELSSKRGKLK